MALTLLTLALVAQETPAAPATPVPTPTATAVPIPAAPVIVLPTPAATPIPRATPSPRATPTPRAEPTPEPTPTPTPTATPTPQTAPAPTPAADTVAVAAPSPAPSPSVAAVPVTEPQAVERSGWAWWWLVIAALAGAAVSAFVMRRRPPETAAAYDDAPVPLAPPPPPRRVEPASPPPPTAPAARLGFVLRPTRAGLNLLSALVEAELTVTNVGPEGAEDIRVMAMLTSVHDGHEAVLAGIFTGEDGRPAVPPFALAPGEARTLRVVAAQPREAIQGVTAAGRQMLVPLVAVNCRYLAGGERRQAAQSFAVGIERADSAKLAPFWLDQPPRTVSEVGARPHTERIER